jgi:cellobiose phosphorylase
MGIRPTFEGLQVAPVIPSAWDGFEAVRSYRGVRYDIKLKRNGLGNRVRLEVDGNPVNGTIIPIPTDGIEVVPVTVWLGE